MQPPLQKQRLSASLGLQFLGAIHLISGGGWRFSDFSAPRRLVLNMLENEPFQSEIIDGDILAIVLRGDLDSTSAPEFDRQTQAHLDAGYSKIIIDCRRLGFISSLGIASLIGLQTKLRRKGGEVKLAAIFGMAMDVLRVVHIDKILNIYGDLEFARKSFYPVGQASQAKATNPASRNDLKSD